MTDHVLPEDKDKRFVNADDRDHNNNSSHIKANDFTLSENAKSLGILRIAREQSTIVIEIKVGQNSAVDPFIMRMAMDFKNWNNFIKTIKSNILSNLKFEVERKQLNRIIATVETVVNQNYGTIKTPINRPSTNESNHIGANEQGEDNNITGAGSADNTFNDDKSNESIPFLTINELVKMQGGTFNTKAAIISITPIMHAIVKIKWKCSNDATDGNGNALCANPYNERTFDPPLLRLDGLKLQCRCCFKAAPDVGEANVLKEMTNYVIIQIQDDYDSPSIDDDLQKMTTIVYDEHVDSVYIGESIKIHGNVKVPLKSYDKREWNKINASYFPKPPMPKGFNALESRINRMALNEAQNAGVEQGLNIASGALIMRALGRNIVLSAEGELLSRGLLSGGYEAAGAGEFQWGSALTPSASHIGQLPLSSEAPFAPLELGVVPAGKTVAGVQSGQLTMSGFGAEGYSSGVRGVFYRSWAMGDELRPAGPLDWGYPGAHYASHAERQAAIIASGQPITVSSTMCLDCVRWFTDYARFTGQTQVVFQPNRFSVFQPLTGVTHFNF